MKAIHICLGLVVVLVVGLIPFGGQVVAVEILSVKFDGGDAVRVVGVILIVELGAGLIKTLQQIFQILGLLLHCYKVTNKIDLSNEQQYAEFGYE